jgi:hypothetical protein
MSLSQTKLFLLISLLMFVTVAYAQQINDTSFNTNVLNPAYSITKPRVLVDAAHNNVFALGNRFDPFVALMSSDGYSVEKGSQKFTRAILSNYNIVVIMTATGVSPRGDSTDLSAFSHNEIDILYDWIMSGGSLLFAIDHSPFSYAGRELADGLGVKISFGTIEDSVHSEAGVDKGPDGRRATLVFSRGNGLLGEHPVTNGRNAQEHIKKVAVWGGESLTAPIGSTTLFRLSPTAYNRGIGENKIYRSPITSNNAQAIAFYLGKGRVVLTADCSMWTAQLVKLNNTWLEYGMARKDLDNRQFALNVMHWLSHLTN